MVKASSLIIPNGFKCLSNDNHRDRLKLFCLGQINVCWYFLSSAQSKKSKASKFLLEQVLRAAPRGITGITASPSFGYE